MTLSHRRSAAGAPRVAIATLATLALILFPTLAKKGPRAAAPPGPYVVTDLGTFGGGSERSGLRHQRCRPGGRHARAPSAFLWQNGVMTDLGTLGGNSSGASAINDAGQVVGSCQHVPRPRRAHAVLLGGRRDDRPHARHAGAARPTGSTTRARWSATSATATAFLWENGVLTDLGHLGGGGGIAVGHQQCRAGRRLVVLPPYVTPLGPHAARLPLAERRDDRPGRASRRRGQRRRRPSTISGRSSARRAAPIPRPTK